MARPTETSHLGRTVFKHSWREVVATRRNAKRTPSSWITEQLQDVGRSVSTNRSTGKVVAEVEVKLDEGLRFGREIRGNVIKFNGISSIPRDFCSIIQTQGLLRDGDAFDNAVL